MAQDIDEEYRKARNLSYSHKLVNQINSNTKARVESDLTLRAHENFMQSLTAARAEASFQEEVANKNKNLAENKNDLFKQMKDHRRAAKITTKKKQKYALELKLLDKLDTERDKVQSTTQRLRDIELQKNNN